MLAQLTCDKYVSMSKGALETTSVESCERGEESSKGGHRDDNGEGGSSKALYIYRQFQSRVEMVLVTKRGRGGQ